MAAKKTNKEIENRYVEEDKTIVQERNDFLLPQILDFVNDRKWMNLQPEYQRRQVWDRTRRSKFIESLLMNLPVPQVFLFEPEYSRYEVMDGQQRLGTIVDFYSNKFKLTGLDRWPELNNKAYGDLPPLLRRGLDRRRMSAVVLQSNSGQDGDDTIRRLVFERLNTGGQKLNAQELRNCLYSGEFATLLVSLAGTPKFNDMLEMPRYKDYLLEGHVGTELAENTLFKRMLDCEIVLRFFAFRSSKSIKGAVKSILDNCMNRYKAEDKKQVEKLRTLFLTRLDLAHSMFGIDAFKIRTHDREGVLSKEYKLSIPFYDGVMIACDRLYDHRVDLIKKAKAIRRSLEALAKDAKYYEIIVARANTADYIKRRLELIESAFAKAL